MVFKNKLNGQIANIVNNDLINIYLLDDDWIKVDNPKILNNSEIDFDKYIKIEKNKIKLRQITEDIIQAQCGEIVPDLESKKNEFVLLHNELRVLEGKPKRDLVNVD